MPELPTDPTLTFLFSDIEGSTRLWEQQTALMRPSLERHDALMRAAISGNGGVVVRTIGDSFFAVFRVAVHAVEAALAAQRALWAEPWDPACMIRVRMGMHTGSGEMRDGDYYGSDLNRAARVLSTASGGQVVMSTATLDAVRDELPAGITLKFVGEHRLKDLARPEKLYQVVAPDLPADFPPLKSLDSHQVKLPVQNTPFVGRTRELEEIVALLKEPGVRMVTLLGPGGTGKTRLSLQVGAEITDDIPSVIFVPLAPVSDPDYVLVTIAEVLEVQEPGDEDILSATARQIGQRNLLLILDNFEQVIPAAAVVADLLARCPNLRVLVSSREVLRISAEHTYQVPPLGLPDRTAGRDPATLSGFDAISLFVQRARASKPDFALTNDNAGAVADICIRLDGLPLAIELAAARVRMFPPQTLLSRLSRRLQVLTGGARDLPARQQTLRGAIDWSYQLLNEEEQTLFARFSVFSGGCSFEAVEALFGEDEYLDVFGGLESLVDKSLIRSTEEQGEPRFTMLELLGEYAAERLEESGEAGEIHLRHARLYCALAHESEPQLRGATQSTALARMDMEHDNLRAALAWLLDHNPVSALGLAAYLWRYWYTRGQWTEGRIWLTRTLTAADNSGASADRAKALLGAGALAWAQSHLDEADTLLEESLSVAAALNDSAAQAAAQSNLGMVAWSRGECSGAGDRFEAALRLYRAADDRWGMAVAEMNLGLVRDDLGDLHGAARHYAEALSLYRRMNDTQGISNVLTNLGHIALTEGDLARAGDLYEESLTLRRDLGDQSSIAVSLHGVAAVARERGELDRAVALLSEALQLAREVGDRATLADCLHDLAVTFALTGEAERAATLLGAAEALLDGEIPAYQTQQHERLVATLQATLGETPLDVALTRGRTLSADQAVELSLAS